MMPKKKTEEKTGVGKAFVLKYCKLLTIIFGSDFQNCSHTSEKRPKIVKSNSESTKTLWDFKKYFRRKTSERLLSECKHHKFQK